MISDIISNNEDSIKNNTLFNQILESYKEKYYDFLYENKNKLNDDFLEDTIFLTKTIKTFYYDSDMNLDFDYEISEESIESECDSSSSESSEHSSIFNNIDLDTISLSNHESETESDTESSHYKKCCSETSSDSSYDINLNDNFEKVMKNINGIDGIINTDYSRSQIKKYLRNIFRYVDNINEDIQTIFGTKDNLVIFYKDIQRIKFLNFIKIMISSINELKIRYNYYASNISEIKKKGNLCNFVDEMSKIYYNFKILKNKHKNFSEQIENKKELLSNDEGDKIAGVIEKLNELFDITINEHDLLIKKYV